MSSSLSRKARNARRASARSEAIVNAYVDAGFTEQSRHVIDARWEAARHSRYAASLAAKRLRFERYARFDHGRTANRVRSVWVNLAEANVFADWTRSQFVGAPVGSAKSWLSVRNPVTHEPIHAGTTGWLSDRHIVGDIVDLGTAS